MGIDEERDDIRAIEAVVVDSQHLIDSGGWARLAEDIFAAESDGVVPEADFGFAVWRGSAAIHDGFGTSLARFEACMHAITNLRVHLDGDRATARYYVQGWHWVRGSGVGARPADFVVLGIMNDELVRQPAGWRVRRRRLDRLGPGVAVGDLPGFLAGLGES